MPKRVRSGFLLIALACLAVSLLFAIAVPNLLRWRLASSEISAPGDLQHIDEAVKAYIAEHGTPPPALSSLRGRIVPDLSCDAPTCDYRSYRFHYAVSQGSSKARYSISAQALRWHWRSFYVDETGVVRSTEENRAATASDPPLSQWSLRPDKR
jgi:hypothetical protein